MDFLPEAAGPHDPLLTTTARHPGSIRRTSNIDTARPDGFAGNAVVDGRARDLRTSLDGRPEVLEEASVQITLSPTQKILSIRTSPEFPALDALVGAQAGLGFRSGLNAIVAAGAACQDGSPLYLLLDDLPGATLVSGYALHSSGALDRPVTSGPASPRPVLDFSSRGDLCAGWANDATMMVHIRQTGSIPVPLGPVAPVLESADDPLSWHAMVALAPHTVRRRRRLDLIPPTGPAEAHRIDLHFRDSHVDGEGRETIMHEYTVTGSVNGRAGRIVDVTAVAQVLPWLECPGAVASAQRIAGMELSLLRPVVRKEFVGRSTCTHLNDSLRSLADLATLYRELEPSDR
jgi:Protein of unknown function (DUF2889)